MSKKIEQVFNILHNIYKNRNNPKDMNVIVGGKERTLTPHKQYELVNKAIQCFMHYGAVTNKDGKQIQAFSGSSDLPEIGSNPFNVTMALPEFDMFYQNAFKTISLGESDLNWDIDDVSSGLAFVEVPEGGKAKFESISGATTTHKVKKYAAGISFTWETMTGRKLYKFIQQLEDARAKMMDLYADVHYSALATAGATNQIAYQGIGTDPVLTRDIATLNAGLDAIALANKDKGYGSPSAFRYQLYIDPSLESRIETAFQTQSVPLSGSTPISNEVLKRNVSRYYSYNDNIPANKALLVIPGNKIQNAVKIKELGLSKQEIDSLNELKVYWTAFGVAIGDLDQVYELAFA